MDFDLKGLPTRFQKPRQAGITMAMDKGLSIREAEDFMSVSAPYTDLVKLGWATALFTPNLETKLALYRDYGMAVYFGGTLFEAYIVRGQFDDYQRLLDKYNMEYVEVSDGSIELPHDEKCSYIEKLSKNYTVLSEVGSKDSGKIIPPYRWINLMQAELSAGSYKVIGEAREAGNVGLFRPTGEVREGLVEEILTQIPFENIIWEAPQKAQQVFFIKLLGPNVNLGNISPNEMIPLETIRMGLRGDTFTHFLEKA